MKPWMRKFVLMLCYKRIDESKINSMCISLKKNDLRYFSLSTNTIISFNKDGKLYYFRECPKILPFSEYCVGAIDNFFDNIYHFGISKEHFKQKIPIATNFSPNIVEQFKSYIGQKMLLKSFVKSMENIDVILEKCGFSIWKKNSYNSCFLRSIGIDDIGDNFVEISIYFLWYMRSVASQYRTLRFVRGRNYSYFNAVRSIASRIVAEEAGLAGLISNAKFCSIELESGKKIFGIISDAVPGCRMMDITTIPTGALQRELLALNALDVILYQPDHGPNNYNVWFENQKYKICAFDNDNPNTFFPLFSVRVRLSDCCPFVDDKGLVARPFFDKTTASLLNGINFKRLKSRLKPYLNNLQIAALIYRLKKINQAIRKTQNQRNLLLSSNDFDEKTISLELNGDYGITYLLKAMNSTQDIEMQ